MKPQTIRQTVHDIAEKLEAAPLYYGHGTDNAWDEAVALVFQALRIPFDVSDEILERPLEKEEQTKLENLLKQRIDEKLPVPYLTNEAYFCGLPFYVDQRVIIPRSLTAALIEQQFSPWVKPENVHRILDLCTGSACIAIACAFSFEYAAVDAVELNEDALAVAKINIEKHQVQNQVNLIQSDLFENLHGKKYDIIVTNPPYVGDEELQSIPAEYQHEPLMALRAEDDGLALAIKILQQAKHCLNEKGVLVMEVGNSWEALQERFPGVPFLWLEFENNEEGIFLLTVDQLREFF